MSRPSYKEMLFDERKDREEQLRWIKDAVNGSAKFYREPPYSYEEELAREIMQLHTRIAELEAEVTKGHELQDSYCDRIAELESAQRWIPINEPPKESGEYFTLSDLTYYKGCAGTSMYNKSINHWWDDGTVTHWMPLPKPPEVQE